MIAMLLSQVQVDAPAPWWMSGAIGGVAIAVLSYIAKVGPGILRDMLGEYKELRITFTAEQDKARELYRSEQTAVRETFAEQSAAERAACETRCDKMLAMVKDALVQREQSAVREMLRQKGVE
jgi:hypothetical protein